MERRSWLWHSQSFDKTESSESMSSHSERLSEVYATQTASSAEVMSKAASDEEVLTDVHTLTEKLATALLDISAKEELLKQNAKVAEEAVSGWEKAENEVLTLKQQLVSQKQKNVVLEDQISHLNGELKDCIRQLRQTREEQEQNIHETVVNNSFNWESKRSELEWKVAELEAQLETSKEDAATSVNSDLLQRLQYVERENSSLKTELQSRLEELEFKTIEMDLSTQAAETASKQHLESIEKMGKLETECQRLNAMAYKTFSANDLRPSTQIDLMDDFLEMERLAALPDTESVSSFFVVGTASDQPNVDQGTDTSNAEGEALVQKNVALEKKLGKMEVDRVELQMDLKECQKQLEASQIRVKEAELEVIELQNQLGLAYKSNEDTYEELKAAQAKNEKSESKLRASQTEAEELISKICSLEEEIEKERALSDENLTKCENLKDELLRMEQKDQLQQETEILHREGVDSEFMFSQEKELALAASRFSECRKTIESLGLQLKSLATLEDFLLDSEDTMELSSEITPPGPHDDGEQLKLHNSDLSLPKRDSESSTTLNPSISYGKSHFSFGRFYPTSKDLSRT